MSAVAIVHPALAKASFEMTIRPLLTGREQYASVGVRLADYAFPYLDVDLDWPAQGRTIRLRVDGTDYPYRPVGGWWVTPSGERMLSGHQQIPVGLGFHASKEDQRPWPWFCFLGWREYHDHSSHQDTSWASVREHGRLSVLQLVIQLQVDLNKPGVSLA